MAKIPVEKVLLKAKSHLKKGELSDAKTLYEEILKVFPKNKRAQKGLAAVTKPKQSSVTQGPSQETINQLINLYNQGYLEEIIGKAVRLTEKFPEAFFVWNILGAAYKGLNRISDAAEAFRQVTELNPTYPDGFNNLGIALKDQGKLDEAIDSYKTAISLKPNNAEAYNNMGNALKEQGKLDEAIAACKKAISLKPDYAEAYNNIGNALRNHSKLAEAIASYEKALSLKPDDAEAHNNMGVALKDLGKLAEAITSYEKALLLKPNNAEAHNNIGNALKDQGELYKAIASYEKALSLKPDYAEAYNNMGNALKDIGKLEEAIASYEEALSLKPTNPQVYNNMGNALRDQGKLDEALKALKKATILKPDYAEAFNNMGLVCHSQGELDTAIEAFEKAISIDQNNHITFNNLGVTLQEQGKVVEAVTAFNKALSVKVDYSETHRNLSILMKYEPNDPKIALVGKMIKRSDLDDYEKCHFHYTYAKMNEDIGDIQTAFEHYVAGGYLRRKLISYDHKQDKNSFDQIKTTALKLKDILLERNCELRSHIPMFILGMPRSGTTLIEQILSSHSQVHGAGELKFMENHGGKLCIGEQSVDAGELLRVRDAYLAEIKKVSKDKLFVTDKMPQNFMYIALISAALPEAKIIHVKRDAAATCWSNFKHFFSGQGLGFSYDIHDTVNYYKMYYDLMEFWDEIYGTKIYHLDYEKLTIDQETETRKLIEYLDIPWEAACLFPQENKRNVKTASQQQVRKKVYAGSSLAWRKFEPYLNGAFKTLT